MLPLGAWLAGCLAPGERDEPTEDPVIRDPRITGLSLSCGLESGQWRLDVTTDAWAAGGGLLWTVDGEYVEMHNQLRSIRAASDGLQDELRADLVIVSDFRPAGTGGLTAFTCNAEPTAFVFVLGLDESIGDCRSLGPNPELLGDLEGAPDCPIAWEEED